MVKWLKCREVELSIVFCMGVKLGLSHSGEERRLRAFENRVLGRIFGSKRDEMTGDSRRLHNDGLHHLYFCMYSTVQM